MPIDNIEDRGTEKNWIPSDQYCKYCYQDGAFTSPDMTLGEMTKITEDAMRKRHLPDNIIQQSLKMLPTLKRWNKHAAEMEQ
jgi:hypothetical protein